MSVTAEAPTALGDFVVCLVVRQETDEVDAEENVNPLTALFSGDTKPERPYKVLIVDVGPEVRDDLKKGDSIVPAKVTTVEYGGMNYGFVRERDIAGLMPEGVWCDR